MVPSEMEDGLCLLDVIGDPNLLNEFLETEGGSGSAGHSQALAAAAQAQAEAQVQASTDSFHLNGTPLDPGVSNHNGGFLAPSTTLTSSQSSGASNQRSVTPISSETSNFIQTVHRQSTPSPRNGSPLIPTNTHMMVNSLPNNHIQYVAGRRSASPATGQTYSTASSPLLARTRTPSQSPVPIQTNVGSPMFAPNQTFIKVSRSVTPSQQSITTSSSISPAPGINVNTFQLQTSMQPSLPVANTMQIQGIIQTPGSAVPAQFSGQTGQQFIQQKTVVQSHPNLVQTQPQQVIHSQPAQTVLQNIQNQNLLQAIQQNPGLLQSLGYNTGAVSTTQQVKPSSPGVNLYSTVQGSVQNPVGLQGTIIQTAQGKSILIPNNLSGKPLTVAGLQNLQPIAVRPQVNLQSQTNPAGIATINSLQGQPNNQVGQPQISVLNINPQGQQIVIQRAAAPGQHPQNIIVRTIPQNFIQLQTPGGQTSHQISTSQSQILSQISQNSQIINSQSQGSIPLQPLLNSSQGQQINILNQRGLQVNPQGTVTLNIANQNVNLSQGNFQPTQLQAQPQRSLPNQQVIQPQSTNTLPVISQHSIQTNQQGTPLTSKSSKKSNKKAQAAANKAQQLAAATSRQGIQVIRPANQTIISAQTSSQPGLQPTQLQTQQIVNSIGISDSMNVKNHHMMLVQSSPGVSQGHISGGMNVSSINYSTANTAPVTTTVTHSTGPMVSHVSLSNNIYSAPLSTSSVLASPQVSVLNGSMSSGQTSHQQGGVVTQLSGQSTATNANVPSNIVGRTQPPLQFQTIQLSQQDHQALQRIQQELKPLLEQKPQTPEQNTKMQQLILLHRRILNKGKQQQLALSAQQTKTGQQIVMKDQQGSVIINKTLPQTSVQAGTTEIQIPSQPAQNLLSGGNLSHVLGQNQTVVKLDVKPASVVQGQLVNQHSVLSNQVVMPAVSANAPPGKLPISASPAVPTQLKIGTHLVTLNLTPQNKEKLVSQLGKMTPEQQQLFYKHQYATIQKLQQQHQIQQQIQAAQLRKQVKAAEGKLPTIIQTGDKPIHIKSSESHISPGRATKRPAVAEIPKGSLIHQQLTKDQEKGLNPEAKTPFKSVKDACQRLLRYHVFQSPGPSTKDFNKVDRMFEHISGELLKKRDTMFAKYQLLLLEESMREKSTAEMVMIERLMTQDLTDVIEKEKKQVDEDPDSFEAMPAKYLKMSPKLKQEPTDSVSPEAMVKSEMTGNETPVDVEHGSSPENPLDMAKSPVRSVMSSSGFKLLIRKNHALNLSSPSSGDASSEKKVHDASKCVDQNVKIESDDMLTSSNYKPPVLDSVSNSPKFGNSSLIANIKTEPDYGFTRSESIQEVPETPFKNFSGESHPHDVFFNDSGPCSPEEANQFSFHGNSFSKNLQESSAKEKPEIIHSGLEDISSDNLPNLEDNSLPTSEHVPTETEGKRSRINSETDAALEGLLNCSNTDNLDDYQFDPEDFRPVGNPSDMTEEEFDISDPFDENGDLFGYGNQYTMGSESNVFEHSRQDTVSSAPSDKVNPVGCGSVSGGDQQIGLVGQYEAISPVSEHSGGLNEDLPSSSENNLMGAHRDYSSYFSQTNQRSVGLRDGMRQSPQLHSLFGGSHSVGQTGVARELDNAVGSIMEFGGCGDQSFSPLIVNDQSSTRHVSRVFSNDKTQDLKSRSVKAASRRDINGGGDSLEEQVDFHKEDNASGHNNSSKVEQMESAINSILSPVSSDHQGSPFPLDEYDFEQYSGYNSSHQTTVMEQQTTEDSAEGSQDQSGIEDDLDAAINSILI